MSRIRLILAGAALAGVVAPLSASADPEPLCRFYWGEPILTTSSDFPVQVEVRRLAYAC